MIKSTYAVFKNAEEKNLIYYPCPKNGNTSAKLFLAKHLGVEDKFEFLGDKIPNHKLQQSDRKKRDIVGLLPTKQRFSLMKADLKCCIIRDPIERFISCYKNRILYHRDKEFRDYDIDEVLTNLENDRFYNTHFLPQTWFLGYDLNYYNFYCDLKNIHIFEKNINIFFGKEIKFPKVQTGGDSSTIELTSNQIKRIKKIYHKDYIFLNSNK